MSYIKYTNDHEYIRVDDGIGTVGITVQRAGTSWATSCSSSCRRSARCVKQGEEAAVVESVKAASEVYTPVGGEVVEVNDATARQSGAGERGRRRRRLVPQDQASRTPRELDALMDRDAYLALSERWT